MIVVIMVMIVVVMVVTVVRDLASRINCFARRLADEESGYFKYLLMTTARDSRFIAAHIRLKIKPTLSLRT